MSVILGRERALFNRHIVEAQLNVDNFEITKERDAEGRKNSIRTMVLPIVQCYTP